MTKQEMLEAFIQRVWIEGDAEAAVGLFDAQGAVKGVVSDMTVGATDFTTVVEAFLGLVEEPRFRIERAVEQGDWLSALVTVEARAPSDQRPIVVTGQIMLRYADGQVAEAYNHFDYVALFQQLGMLPDDALMMLLSGAKVA